MTAARPPSTAPLAMKTSAFSLALLLLGAAPLGAAPAGAPLTLDDCLRRAADNQPLLAAAGAGVSAATEAVGEARAPYWPQVDLSTGYHRWQQRAFLPAGLSLPGRASPSSSGRWTTGPAACPRG